MQAKSSTRSVTAHRRGIIHRDLKPANVMLVKSGARHSCKLLDFGLARIALPRDTTATLLAEPGAVAGTLRYMAPEQLEGKTADARTDIYAFGLVLEEMLGIADMPQPLREVIKRCIARDPEERWQSVRDLRAALDLAQQPPAPQPQAAKRHRALLWVVPTLVIAVIAALLWSRRPLSREPVTFAFGPPAGTTLIPWPGVPSPDGRRIAFVAQDASTPRALWIRSLTSEAPVRLTGTEGPQDHSGRRTGSSSGFLPEAT